MPKTVPLDPQSLLSAYAQGAFPMGDRDGSIGWYTADPRGIIPLETFHVPETLKALVRQQKFECRMDTSFEDVMRACAARRRGGSWINDGLIAAYVRLFRMGYARSIEAWRKNELVGGLYGVALGAAFFGESMFHRARDASKVALVHLVNHLREKNFELLDTQAATPHLRQFGCIDISADDYLALLRKAISKPREFS
jgi:leucyl/phenylalanyl-tRNA---protein transferase